MSAELLARKAVAELRRIRDDKVSSLRRCKPRPPTVTESGGVVPSATCEEISLFAVDVNATIDALNIAIETIEVEYKKLTQPEDPADEDDGKKQARSFYG
jgi:hypothetical protein